MVVTFLATTELPLHVAILIGAITSLVLYCAKAAQSARPIALTPSAGGGWDRAEVPDACPSSRVTVLHYAGIGLFAEVPRIDEEWPRVIDSDNAVVVLSMGTLPDVPPSKVVHALNKWANDLNANGGRLIIAGLSPAAIHVLQRAGFRCARRRGRGGPSLDRGAAGRAAVAGYRLIQRKPMWLMPVSIICGRRADGRYRMQ